MITAWFNLSPFIVAQWIASIAFLSCWLFFASDAFTRALWTRHWKVLLTAILIVIVWRIPLRSTFFHGLEYEDAYVYTVSGRQSIDLQQYDSRNVGSVYLVSVCAVGNLGSCYLSQTYSGHYIGFPSIIRLTMRLFGYNPAISNYVGLFASCIAVVMVFLICQLVTTDLVSAIAACMVFASTPIFAVYGVGSYAEPASNACISVSLFCYLRYMYKHHDNGFVRIINWCAFTLTLVLAVLIKRENIILAIGLPLISSGLLLIHSRPQLIDRKKLQCAFWGAVVAASFGAIELHLIQTVLNETGEYAGFPFAISNAKALLPMFLSSFISPRWYLFTFIFVFLGIGTAYRKSLTFFPVLLFVGYMMLYTTHVRSYYQLHGASTSPADALRLSMNLMSLWSILAGLGIGAAMRFGEVKVGDRKIVVTAIACLYAGVSYLMTTDLQRRSRSAELSSRVEPALVASRLITQAAPSHTYIVTIEPLVVQMFASATVNVMALPAISPRLLTKLAGDDPGATLLFVKQNGYDNQYAHERYASQLGCLEGLRSEEIYVGSTFSVLKMSLPVDDRVECKPASRLAR
jgi:hypothetical protein